MDRPRGDVADLSIFKACDIRGVYGRELTAGIARQIGRSIGRRLQGESVVVGGDVRISTPDLKDNLITGLVEAGCRVVDIGIVPTPAFHFARRFLGAAGGVMVTASHNPAEYNGFKAAFGDRSITMAEIREIEMEIAADDRSRASGGEVVCAEIIPEYRREIRDKLLGFVAREAGRTLPPLRVVIDCGNGCYSRIAPDLFRELGYEVAELFCEEDGRFPNRGPNPAVAENLAALAGRVRVEKAGLGLAFDGDGDRVAFVDGRGNIVENDKIFAALARHMIESHPGGKVVYDVKCSSLVPDEVIRSGGIPVMERAGYAFIHAAFRREDAILGGEISGHFFFQGLATDDGLFAALAVADLARRKGGLGALIDALPRYHTTPDLRLPYHGADKEELLAELAEHLRNDPGCRLSLIDGVRGEFADGWGLVRSSVTEPLLTLRFEARERGDLTRIKDRFLSSAPKIKALVDEVWDRCVNQ